ncbi:MAG: ATP-dependent Clp protease ATP-binding subunit [Clostridia bacterium]|nr:ATP-dependent Clp protease ATP-binding subunit [Clostridia bacterium]
MSNNFTVKAENALNRAVSLAEEFGHSYIGTEHVLLALAEDETSCASIIMRKYRINADKISSAIRDYSGIGSPSKLSSKDTTPKCRRLLEGSYKFTKKYNSDKIGTEHLLLSILEEKECVASKILTKIEADIVGVKDSIITFLRSSQRGVIYAEAVSESNIPNLLKYGKNVTALAERGELDPVIGREKETDRVIRILSRRSKNNPCLIGEAGVGKTAIIEGLAERIVDRRVPSCLLGKIIISIDLTSMVAGAKYRGDFEERIKSIMSEASRNQSVILFIDEIHTIVGAGSAEGAIDAANIMKPELSRGGIQVIGATTLSEYRKYIEKDSALERRFQPILVEEPSVAKTVDILKGIKDRYERHHRVLITDEAIEAAARLSERYIQDRFLPDKAIDLLDEACAFANVFTIDETEKTRVLRENIRQTTIDRKNAINHRDFELAANLKELERLYNDELKLELGNNEGNKSKVTVGKEDVEKIVSEMTGIELCDENKKIIYDLEPRLKSKVIGQDTAVKVLSSAVCRSLAGINDLDRPRGIFLFLGESGVGKTELARALTSELFENEDSLIRYDMSEYSESYSISKLIGSAPGYVGYDEQNSSLERLRKHPYSILLLDEIEKAHPDVLSLFLQIFDTGYLTDATGRRINLRNTYIIMTSNIGADKFKKVSGVGFLGNDSDNALTEKLRSYFKDEFLNRIDEIVLFSCLNHSALKQIAKNKFLELSGRLALSRINLEADESVFEHLSKKASQKHGFGARPLNRLMVSEIENKIADMIVTGTVKAGDTIIITVASDEIQCVKACLALK